jgi:hypothetical protein
VIFCGARILRVHVPPQPPSHLRLEWGKIEVLAVSMQSH